MVVGRVLLGVLASRGAMGAPGDAEPGRGVPGLLRSLLLPAGTALVGSAATASSVSTWYPQLEKPGFSPPSWVFGPVWTTLYAMMGIADHLVASSGAPERQVRQARRTHFVQLALNGLWSVLFFGLRSPAAALVEIVLLWGAIVATIAAFARISRPAALLLVPYLLWTTFATVLNAAIWKLNR